VADSDDDLMESVTAMADRLKIKGKERQTYIHEHMTRGGYRAVPNYVKADDDEDEDKGSGFFGGGGRRRNRGKDDDNDW
jgi:hypothetical protein